MGISSSSLLDESKSNFVRGQANAELRDFSPHYKRQYLVAFFSKVQDQVEQKKTGQTQLLKQREPPKPGTVLYEENVLFFDDARKWREQLIVVRANYSLECHDNYETFMKGVQPRHKLLPTGGTVLTSEDKYMVLVDKLCPDLNNVKEEFGPPVATMPGRFPVYLRLPYRRDYYFCFRQEARRTQFISILKECIRHQNQDFLRKSACEVQAFRKAIRLYREEKGLPDSWDLLIGSDVRVLSNLVMEKLLPRLQTELLPRLKGKKSDRKKAWFATVEAAYILVQQELLKGLSVLKQECSVTAKQQEARIRSDMDQIINSQDFLAGKLRAMVTEPAAKFCSEHVQPHLAPVLEELMGPISSGFHETRALCETHMGQLCQDFQENSSADELKLALQKLGKTDLQGCYAHVDKLQDQLEAISSRYNFSHCSGLVNSTQIDMQQLMGNVMYTFEQLLFANLKDSPEKLGPAMEKAKQRVLKQYDYDSSTVRKRIFQEALLDMTLPAMKKDLAPKCKQELQAFNQYIFADYSNFIQVENVYEDILLQTLESEVSKVVNEAASLKKHNLFLDQVDMRLASQSSLSESMTPPGSSPTTPAMSSHSLSPDSALLENGHPIPECSSSAAEKELLENGVKQGSAEMANGEMHATSEAEEITSRTAEDDKQVTLSSPDGKKRTSSTVEAGKQITPSTPEAEQITSSSAGADTQDTPSAPEVKQESETSVLPNPLGVAEIEDEFKPSKADSELASESNTAEPERESAPDTHKSEGLVHSSVEEQKEDTSSAVMTKEERPGATESSEQAPSATEAKGEDTSCTAEVEQVDSPSVPETSTETSLQSVEPIPSTSPDSAVEENPNADGVVTASTNPPFVEDTDGSDATADPTHHSPDAAGRTEGSEIGADSPQAKEEDEDGDTGWSTEEVSESDVSLTSDPTMEGKVETKTIHIDPLSEATEIKIKRSIATAEEAGECAGTLENKSVSDPTEKTLPTEAVPPTISTPAEARPVEELEQVKAPAPDCVKEIRNLVEEVIEVEEMVQHYPDRGSPKASC
ncbi:hypothetical protein GJAV_G00082280 [Gymnothorax javanicus]|nr:hypothetical protein GJAV_G00082280 [Gymnothorax javanicus]